MKVQFDLQKLVESAVKAPSGHNTQPWRFAVGDDEIQIHPDFSRALPVVDPDNHALYISLGCAAENIVIAATAYGQLAQVKVVKGTDGTAFIRIRLKPDVAVERDELIDYIDQRQSTRNAYAAVPVPAPDLAQLQQAVDFPGIEMMLFTDHTDIQTLEPLIIEGSDRQFKNKAFVQELTDWVRYSKKEARVNGDGIWSASMGFPGLNRFFGNLIMKRLVTAGSEAKRWKKLIRASPGFALFVADGNDPEHWVNLGRAFQRFGLTATKLGISHAHVNMPCEEVPVRRKLAEQLRLGSRSPLLLLRFGYSEKMPYSFRRQVSDVIGQLNDEQTFQVIKTSKV